MVETKRIEFSAYIFKLGFMLLFTFAAAILSLTVGSVNISFGELFEILLGNNSASSNAQIIWEVRLPRTLLAIAVGGGLSVSGAVFQAILMNPLAEPYILGISSGAAFGTIISLLLGVGFLLSQVFSFTGAFLVILLVFLLGRRFGELEPNMLLLSGVMVGAFFSAAILTGTSFLNESLRSAVFWLMGHLSLAERKSTYFIFAVSAVISLLLSLNSQKYNVLSLGSETAKYLGINTSFLKNYTYVLASILIGAIVSVSGIIGFVGLLIPHVCRMIFGVDNRIIIPASFFIGAAYLTFADSIARTIIAPSELPVGAITALLGAPVFVYLLRKRFRTV